jgi:hypothetical protein
VQSYIKLQAEDEVDVDGYGTTTALGINPLRLLISYPMNDIDIDIGP